MYATSPNRSMEENTHDGTIRYMLYETAVVTVSACRRTARLHAGPWRTDTTKRAINDALVTIRSYQQVYQRGGEWYLTHHLVDGLPDQKYVEGMTIMLR